MSWDNKVVWTEGMFLRSQHFQQFDRYVEKLVRGRVGGLRAHAWGFTELQINRELLTTGKFALTSSRGVLEDGTPFNIPEDADHPAPLDMPENTRNCVVYLALPIRQPGRFEMAANGQDEAAARYGASEYEATDANVGSEGVARLRVGRLRLRYMLETEERAGYLCLGLARVVEVKADKSITLDDKYIPTSLVCTSAPPLAAFLTELVGLFHHRGEHYAQLVAGTSAAKGTGDIADFLVLLFLNRYEPLLAHHAAFSDILPEAFYGLCLQMAGELATYYEPTKRPRTFPVYKHEDLQKTFTPVMTALRWLLAQVIETNAVRLPLEDRKFGIRVHIITDRSLLSTATFILAVKASMQAEALRRNFPQQVKIGPVEQIRELVNVALPGVTVRALPVAPRQIPFTSGAAYFELDKSSSYWKQLLNSQAFAIHLSSDFPQAEMEFWAIRG
jgi:type VI secretion system protein ImpJ